jgi:Holliday junction resolvasome RuvABC ATP-dependent DNA helicase subunit
MLMLIHLQEKVKCKHRLAHNLILLMVQFIGNWQPKNQQRVLNEEYDVHGRPMQKIALLCGPPGLGKTTLAHIVAKHAGMMLTAIKHKNFSI